MSIELNRLMTEETTGDETKPNPGFFSGHDLKDFISILISAVDIFAILGRLAFNRRKIGIMEYLGALVIAQQCIISKYDSIIVIIACILYYYLKLNTPTDSNDETSFDLPLTDEL